MLFPKVSVITLNWNGKDDTIECLQSIRGINYPNYETILVDNGSRDGSQEIIKKDFPGVTLIQNSSNLGFAGGMNVGIKEAFKNRAEYVFILNNDTILDPEIINELVLVCQSHREIGAAVPKIYQYYRRDHFDSCGLDITFGPHLGRRRGYGEVDQGKYLKETEVEGFSGCGVLLKKRALEKVGLFDSGFFFYGEDVDLSLRFRKAGYKTIFVPNGKMWHKISASAGFEPNPYKGRLIGEVVIRCMKKNAGFKEWVIFISKTSFLFPVALSKQILKGNFAAFWAKFASGLLALLKTKH